MVKRIVLGAQRSQAHGLLWVRPGSSPPDAGSGGRLRWTVPSTDHSRRSVRNVNVDSDGGCKAPAPTGVRADAGAPSGHREQVRRRVIRDNENQAFVSIVDMPLPKHANAAAVAQ